MSPGGSAQCHCVSRLRSGGSEGHSVACLRCLFLLFHLIIQTRSMCPCVSFLSAVTWGGCFFLNLCTFLVISSVD